MEDCRRTHIGQPLRALATFRASLPTTIYGSRCRNGTEFVHRVLALSLGLRNLGMQHGSRVAIAALNSDWYLEWILAVPCAGGIIAPLNYRWSVEEASAAIQRISASILVVDDHCLPWCEMLRKRCPSLQILVRLGDGECEGVSFNLVEAAMIRHNLYDHKVQFDPSLVGDYTVLSFRQMVPEAPPPSATISTPPAYAPSPHAFSGAMPLAGKLPVFQKSNNNSRWMLIVVIVSAMGLVVCCLFLYWRCVVSVKGENINQSDEKGKVSLTVTMLDSKKEFEPLLQPTGVKLFSYVTLKEATNNFDAANLLGEGGFGRVYCGILEDGTLIAVKKLTTGSQQGDHEFLVEVELLSRLHHRNLVKLLGYFSSHDSTQQ